MDYWDDVVLHRHVDISGLLAHAGAVRIWGFTTKADQSFWDVRYSPRDVLLFGPESRGLPAEILDEFCTPVRIPMVAGTRSLNLASAAAVALYEAIRQLRAGIPPG